MKNALFLSLGSNLKPRRDYLKKAVQRLNKKFSLKSISYIYKTQPLEDEAQDDFYNICVNYKVNSNEPFGILNILKDIEKNIGRKRNIKRPKGPRIIDIDILFFEDIVIDSKKLSIPHKSMFNRKFVLKPLLEILPKDSAYIKKYDLIDCLKKVNNQKIVKIGELVIE